MGKQVFCHICIQPSLGLKVRPEIDFLERVNDSVVGYITLRVGIEPNRAVQEECLLWNRIET